MLRVGHRGTSQGATENTLYAFTKALRSGADGIELDIRRTRDGTLVISHDPTVDRLTEGSGFIKDLDLDRLRSFRTRGNELIPTAEEALGKIADYGKPAFVQIDLKVPGVAGELIGLVREKGLGDVAVISAFHRHLLEEVREHDSGIGIGLIKKLPFNGPIRAYTAPEDGEARWKVKMKEGLHFAYMLALLPVNRFMRPRSFDLIEDAKKLGANYVMCWWGAASRHLVREAHRKGMGVVVGIVNRGRSIKRLERIGVDVMVTDRADLLRH